MMKSQATLHGPTRRTHASRITASITASNTASNAASDTASETGTATESARSLYFALSQRQVKQADDDAACRFLTACLDTAAALPSDLPACADDLKNWIVGNTEAVGECYRNYLAARKAGGARRYFGSKSHALYFLKSVAPTKLVDGAWLYGLLSHWDDGRFAHLIRIYLEELGCGVPDKNHVVLYKKLLSAHGNPKWDRLADACFVQGAIQLALARHADGFLPELIGFNLGYEQLPLHLLITAHELNELGIDPYYFTLHVTVDNADTGHAQTALDGLRHAWPAIGDGAQFYQRVVNGYKLNLLGAGTNDIIDGFDLQQELITILAEKSVVGKQVHSDTCRIGGRSVNQWLADPAQIPAFLDAMQQAGWIQRNQAPANSRFWKLIEGERADMFGVFNAYEQQVLFDWIAGDGSADHATTNPSPVIPMQRQSTFKAQQKLREARAGTDRDHHTVQALQGDAEAMICGASWRADRLCEQGACNDFDQELRDLTQSLNRTASRDEAMQLLAGLMSPALHHTPAGLKATRLFVRMLG